MANHRPIERVFILGPKRTRNVVELWLMATLPTLKNALQLCKPLIRLNLIPCHDTGARRASIRYATLHVAATRYEIVREVRND